MGKKRKRGGGFFATGDGRGQRDCTSFGIRPGGGDAMGSCDYSHTWIYTDTHTHTHNTHRPSAQAHGNVAAFAILILAAVVVVVVDVVVDVISISG